jgi:hypothetical protein
MIIRHVLRFIEVFETYMPLYMREPLVYTMRGELRRCMKKITGRSLWDTWWHEYDDLPENAIEWDIEVSESDKNLIHNMAMRAGHSHMEKVQAIVNIACSQDGAMIPSTIPGEFLMPEFAKEHLELFLMVR